MTNTLPSRAQWCMSCPFSEYTTLSRKEDRVVGSKTSFSELSENKASASPWPYHSLKSLVLSENQRDQASVNLTVRLFVINLTPLCLRCSGHVYNYLLRLLMQLEFASHASLEKPATMLSVRQRSLTTLLTESILGLVWPSCLATRRLTSVSISSRWVLYKFSRRDSFITSTSRRMNHVPFFLAR